MSYQKMYKEITPQLVAARASIENAAEKAWQADDEELSNWLQLIANQLGEALSCIDNTPSSSRRHLELVR